METKQTTEYYFNCSANFITRVEADSLANAKKMALTNYKGYLASNSVAPLDLKIEEHQNGKIEAQWRAEAILEYYGLKEKIAEEIKELELDGDTDPTEQAQAIFDNLYQSEDTCNMVWESIDTRFIYNSTDALKESLDTLADLHEYESGDSGLWEGCTEYADIINRQATDAMSGAIQHYLEKAMIAEAIEQMSICTHCGKRHSNALCSGGMA